MHCSMHFVVVVVVVVAAAAAVVVVAFSSTLSANSLPKIVGTFLSETSAPARPVLLVSLIVQ